MMHTRQELASVLIVGALACTTLACGDDPTPATNNPSPIVDASTDGDVDSSMSDSGIKAGVLDKLTF